MDQDSGSGLGATKRLMIKEMVLENFKSYAGEQRVGPFHKCFSSVVGPNGSGKSNVIDAMLFVFGKRAKQLRLNKVSELIHNSSKHRNLEQAKVSVYFQEIVDTGEETFEVVPGSDFVVSRTAQRSNASSYFIGERRSNFGEVTELLKAKGIDLDNNRFLILQGEVEQISMMKPKAQTPHETGLLEYLEDIIGTDKYVEEIGENANRLEEMNEKRQSMVQRLKIVERERDGLEGARLAAEAYLEKERECAEAQCTVFLLHVKDGERHIATLTTGLSELRQRLEYERKKKESSSASLGEAKARFEAERQAQAGVQARLDETAERFKEFERKDIKLREDIKHLKAKLKKLSERLAADTAAAEENTSKADAAEKSVPKLEQKLEKLAQQLKSKEEELDGLRDGVKGEVAGYQKQLQGVKSELAPWERRIAEAKSRQDIAAAERDLLLKQGTDAAARLEAAKQGAVNAASAAKAKQAEIAEMKKAAGRHRDEAAKARAACEAATKEATALEGGWRESRAALERRRADSSSARSQSAIVEALMAAKRSGEIQGIHGRLGDLGAIDKRFDVAASTACGGLDNIVVEDTAAAMRCVELVRRRGLGVVTCLMLDRLAHLGAAVSQKAAPPEGVKRLFDLVKIRDEKLRVAFYSALGNTLVARDLDQAARIAYGSDRRWSRVVTLQGDMINETGTMSGGGGKPRSGRMCVGDAAPRPADTREAAAELEASEAAFNDNVQALEAARARASAAEETRVAAEKALSDLEVAIPKAELEVAAQQQKAADLKQQLRDLEAATKVTDDDAARLETLEAAVAAAESELDQLRKSAGGLQARAARFTVQIDEAGGEPMRALKASVASLQEEIAKGEEAAARAKVDGQAARKAAERLQKACAKKAQEKAESEAELETRRASMEELETAAVEVAESQRKIVALFDEKSAELAIIREDYEAKCQEVNTIRTVEVELEAKISDLATKHDFETRARDSNLRRLDERRRKLAAMFGADAPPPPPSDEELGRIKLSDFEFRVTVLEEDLARMTPDMGAIEAWRQKEADYAARVAQLEEATSARDEVRRGFDDLKKRRLDEFMAGFSVISLKLKEMYQMITLGGDAELELVDSLDPFSEGIVFSVRPPKKSWKNISNLSGGEKTLSSLSLVFALHHYKPTPLYVMDEIDAALDFKNVSIVAHYIKERTKNAQFVIISLRNNMFELADRLVGIYKTDNATKSVAINPGEFSVGVAAPPPPPPAPPSFQVALAGA